MTPMHRSMRSTPPHCGYGDWAFAMCTGTPLKESPSHLVPDTVLYVMWLKTAPMPLRQHPVAKVG
jgi:hypothetical protein